MYLGIDIGGTKTLLAVFSDDGQIIDEHRFPTNPKYSAFIKELGQEIKNELSQHKITAACAAVTDMDMNRQTGEIVRFGNLSWREVNLLKDLQQVLPEAKIYIENDGKLGGLSEALAVQDSYNSCLYIAIGTGVGVGHTVDGKIDTSLSDRGGRGLTLEHDGKLMDWDDISSGRALVTRYGHRASEISDPKIWQQFAADLAKGIDHFVAATKPEVIIIGGGVGRYFDRFGHFLNDELQKVGVNIKAIEAKRPEEAVIYGCYDYIRGHQT